MHKKRNYLLEISDQEALGDALAKLGILTSDFGINQEYHEHFCKQNKRGRRFSVVLLWPVVLLLTLVRTFIWRLP